MSEQTKDPMILFKSVKRDVNDAGKLRLQLSLTQEQAANLASVLTSLASNERGVKLDTHISKKQSQDGREFDSAITFVKPIQEFGSTQRRSFPSTPSKGYVSADAVKAAKASVTKRVEG